MNKNLEEYLPDGNKAQYRFMKYRIHKILLVCCSYDGYILEEDGHIESQINQEYLDLNMSNPPSFTRVSSTREALELLGRDDSFDFILTMYNVGELDVFTFAKIVKERHPQIPVALLTSFSKDIYRRIEEQDRSGLDYIFGWHGNTDLIMAIIKLVEDKMNAEEDIVEGGVQAILLVEDSIRFYSTYLPELYKLILLQNTEFLKDALNEQQQILRKRARPKILLATNYEEAVELYDRYKKNMLGVISDVGFVLHRNDPPESEKRDAGIDLCRRIKEDNPLMPVLLQSSQTEFEAQARGLGAGFIAKNSKTLLSQLHEYIAKEFAFGDFLFKDPDTGAVIGRAKDLAQMQEMIATIPIEFSPKSWISASIRFRCSSVRAFFSPLRLAAPMSYMLTVATAFSRGSIFAALTAKLPLPQIPIAPMPLRSTNSRVPRKSAAALKSSAYISGETVLRGSPSLSPQNDRSMASVTNPRSAILIA